MTTSFKSASALRPLKLWHQSMTELDGLGVYRDSLARRAQEILGSDGAIEIFGIQSGAYHGKPPTEALSNAFVYHRVLDQVIDNAVQAEKQGYDAFIIGSFSEPFLREIRSVVSIPVASILESSMLAGCSLGKKIAAIANSPKVALMVQTAIEKHALTGRVMPARSIEPALDEPQLAAAYQDPAPVLANFVAVARKAIAEGAEVIVPAEGVMASLLQGAGLREIDGAPVIDVFALTWRYAVMLARLRESTGLQTATIGTLNRADPALVNALLR